MKNLLFLPIVMIVSIFSEEVAAQDSFWSTNWNVMKLSQDGDTVTGEYIFDSGVLIGTFEGNILRGWWREAGNAIGCGPDNNWSGPLVFHFSDDWTSFTGDWGYCDANPEDLNPDGSGWTGTLQEGVIDYTETDCLNAGRYWCDGSCQIQPCGTDLTEEQCVASGNIWCNGVCQVTSCTPSLAVNSITVTEGNTSTPVKAAFSVTLSEASSQQVTVDYATANGSAVAPNDFTAKAGTLNFTPGQISKTVSVSVVGDLLDEANEVFSVNLSNPANATIVEPEGRCTIKDDDAPAALSINNVTVTEGNVGTVNATFTVTLSSVSGKNVKVNYATANGTATAGVDYTATSGTLTIAAGALTGTFTVPVSGDLATETDETFTVTLSTPVGATLADDQGTGTISNDDAALPEVFIGDVIVREGDNGKGSVYFTVRLSSPAPGPITVQYATANGTANPATASSDYTAEDGTVSFAAGQVTRTVAISVTGDIAVESNEKFFVNLSNADGATIVDKRGIGTIVNDDVAVAASMPQ